MTVHPSKRNTFQQYIWLMGGALFLFCAFVFWIITDSDELLDQTTQIEETQVQIQPEKVAATTYLGGLTDQVKPLELTARKVAATALHLPEFRGTKFFQENKNNYFIELFRVSNEDIIKSFLNKHTDRHQFIYFRLSGEDQVEQYILGYGLYMGEGAAKTALNSLALQLPPSVRPKVSSFKQYLELVNDMGSEELSGTKLYEVHLKPVAIPVIDEAVLAARQRAAAAAQMAAKQQPSSTSVTITRRDQAGNIVDVQRSQNNVAPAPKEQPKVNNERKNTETQISDPFN